MKMFFGLLAVVPLSLTVWCQGPPQSDNSPIPQKLKPSPFKEFAGKWVATFDGRIWLSLQLELNTDQLTGSLQHAQSFDLNDNGDLKSVSDEQSSGIVTAAEVTPDGLLLTVKDPDSQETDRYMMRIVTKEKDNAELRMIAASMPPGMPKPKPWRLVKSGVAITNTVAAPR
jgi:hypothetical protein